MKPTLQARLAVEFIGTGLLVTASPAPHPLELQDQEKMSGMSPV